MARMPFEAQKQRKAKEMEGKEQRILFERDCDSRVVVVSHPLQIPTISRTDSQALKQLVHDQHLAYGNSAPPEAPNLNEKVTPQTRTSEEQPVDTDKEHLEQVKLARSAGAKSLKKRKRCREKRGHHASAATTKELKSHASISAKVASGLFNRGIRSSEIKAGASKKRKWSTFDEEAFFTPRDGEKAVVLEADQAALENADKLILARGRDETHGKLTGAMSVETERRFQSRAPHGSITRTRPFNIHELIDVDTNAEPLKQDLNPFSIRSKESLPLDGYTENKVKMPHFQTSGAVAEMPSANPDFLEHQVQHYGRSSTSTPESKHYKAT
ncbi:hypothetical protein NDN08_008189 [Rhodosorus marinus]|uniref:Ribosome biogenesis protein NOP53 n=1 Tax=Rhodosorus marinus TaxID=101924 RepID=A0AAV8V1D3_9RHOD|nr:hypothetical protein NDN08_008189 [Rhodosorus marinus]